MAEATIVRSQCIVVNEVGANSYGDLTFTDKENNQYKISVKRKQYFEKVILPNVAVQLNYAMSSFGKEYIYSAVQVKEGLPPPVTPKVVTSSISKTEPKPQPKTEITGQTIGMTTKEVGDLIRAKMLTEVFKEAAPKVNAWYKSQMLHNMGIVVESPLVKIAKQQGAVEEEKEV